MEHQVELVLEESLDLPTANPIVGDVFTDRWLQRGNEEHCRSRLGSSSGGTAVWQRAVATYLEKMPQYMRMTEAHKFIQNNAAALRADDETWGLVGYTFYELGRYPDVVEWLSDWRSRTALRPWMLWNYVLALRELDRHAEAYEVGQAALQLAPDDLSDEHRVLIALDDALANQSETATKHLRQIAYERLRDWAKCSYNTAVMIIRAVASSESKLRQFSKLAALRETYPFFWKDKLLFTFHCRAAMKIGESTDNALVKLWAHLLLRRLCVKRSFMQAQDSRIWKRLRILAGQ